MEKPKVDPAAKAPPAPEKKSAGPKGFAAWLDKPTMSTMIITDRSGRKLRVTGTVSTGGVFTIKKAHALERPGQDIIDVCDAVSNLVGGAKSMARGAKAFFTSLATVE